MYMLTAATVVAMPAERYRLSDIVCNAERSIHDMYAFRRHAHSMLALSIALAAITQLFGTSVVSLRTQAASTDPRPSLPHPYHDPPAGAWQDAAFQGLLAVEPAWGDDRLW